MTFASACSGHGFKHSAAVGQALAQRLTRGHGDLDLAPFSLASLGERAGREMVPAQHAAYREIMW